MKRLVLLFVATALFAGLTVTASPQSTPSGDRLLAAAKQKARDDGDLTAAIEMYKRIVASAGTDRVLAASALVGMAECYETLGRPEARATLELIVKDYASTGAPASTARTKLASMDQKGSGFTVRQVWNDAGDTVSPDGRYITTTHWDTGDLAIHEIASGRNRVLTNNGKWNDSFAEGGVPSPDSAQIVYRWNDNQTGRDTLRVINRDGGSFRVVYSSPDESVYAWPIGWTPDGRAILATLDVERRANGQLVSQSRDMALIPVDGQPLRVLKHFDRQARPGAGPIREMNPSLSPDGRYVAYSTPATDTKPERDIVVLSVATGREVAVVDHPADDEMQAWFPTSDRILFSSDRGEANGFWAVGVVNGARVGEPQLIRDNVGNAQTHGFSRNGDFYFSTRLSELDVYIATLASGGQRSEPARIASRFVGLKRQAVWSPTGDRIAFLRPNPSRPGLNAELGIHTLSTSVTRTVPIAMQQAQNPAWFPDGRAVVVQGRDLEGRQGIFKIGVDDGAVTPIATRTADSDIQRSSVAVAPDGSRLFFRWQVPGTAEGGIAMRDLASGQETRITRTPVSDLAVSPDGKWFATSDFLAGGANNVLSLWPSSGGNPTPLAGGAKNWISVFTWTADSRGVIAVHRADRRLEIWVVPIDGSAPTNTGLTWQGGLNRISSSRDGRLALSTDAAVVETWVLQNLPGGKK